MANEHEEGRFSGNSDKNLNGSQSSDKHSSQLSTTEEKHIIEKIFAHPFEQKGYAKTTGQLVLQIAIVFFIVFVLPLIVIAVILEF